VELLVVGSDLIGVAMISNPAPKLCKQEEKNIENQNQQKSSSQLSVFYEDAVPDLLIIEYRGTNMTIDYGAKAFNGNIAFIALYRGTPMT
jgi:hypothetical protein